MKIFYRRLISILSVIIFALTGVGQSVIGFTAGTPVEATRRNYSFDNRGLIVGGYYSTKDELKYCNDAGIQFVIASGVNRDYLDTAQNYGVGVIATGYNYPYSYMDMSDSVTQAYVNADIRNYKDHPALWGDNVIDEPTSASYGNIAKAVDKYYSLHPNHIPFVNLFPMYANEDQLNEHMTLKPASVLLTPFSDHFNDQVNRFKAYTSDYINTIDTDYICVDIYPYDAKLNSRGDTVKSTGEYWIRNLDVLAEACRDTGRDLWVITQAAGLTKDGVKNGDKRWCDEASDISQQVFASLAFGTKAIIHGIYGHQGWWDVDSHMIGSNGKPTDTYYAVSEVDGYIQDFAQVYGDYNYTSTYLVNRTRIAGYRHGKLACEVIKEEGNIKSSNGLLVGTFTGKDNSSKAYIVANMEELNKNKTAQFSFNVPEGKVAAVYYKGTVINKASDFTMKLDAGAGAFITVK